MAKSEEQIMLERLGVYESTTTHDSDFDGDSATVDELQEERERLDSWQSQIEQMEERVRVREDEVNELLRENKREKKRLTEWAAELAMREAHLDEREANSPEGTIGTVLDDGAIDELRRKKKAEKLKKKRMDAFDMGDNADEIRSVWSTGWNT